MSAFHASLRECACVILYPHIFFPGPTLKEDECAYGWMNMGNGMSIKRRENEASIDPPLKEIMD